jgi:hypothetical protein
MANTGPLSDLRKWLRKLAPAKVLMRKDEEERTVAVNHKSATQKWANVEKAILSWGAEKVEALNGSGEILDVFNLGEDEEEKVDLGKGGDKSGHDYRGLASIIDRIAARQNEAYAAGADSNSKTVEQMVTIVDTLTSHLSMAITNVHNLSVNLASVIAGQEAPEQQNPNSPMLERVLGMAVAHASGMPAPQQAPPNGAKKP